MDLNRQLVSFTSVDNEEGTKLIDSLMHQKPGRNRDLERRYYDESKRPTPALFINRLHFCECMQRSTFMAYGNEATLSTAYWKVAMFVTVGPYGARRTAIAGASGSSS